MPPQSFRTAVTATLSVRDWARAIEFYKTAFGAEEVYRVPCGGISRLSVSGAAFWVAEESPAHLNFSPQSLGGCSVRMLLIVEDPAAVCQKAVAAGARQVRPVTEEHGWRLGADRRSSRTPLGNRPTAQLKRGAVFTGTMILATTQRPRLGTSKPGRVGPASSRDQ